VTLPRRRCGRQRIGTPLSPCASMIVASAEEDVWLGPVPRADSRRDDHGV